MFDHLLESSHQDDSNKWSNIGFGEEIGIIETQIRTLSGPLTITRLLRLGLTKFVPMILDTISLLLDFNNSM